MRHAPDELNSYVIASVLLLGVFGLLAWSVVAWGVPAIDGHLLTFHDLAVKTPSLVPVMQLLTNALGTWAFGAVAALGCIELVRRREYLLALIFVSTLAGVLGLSEAAKHLIHRPRPPLAGLEGGWSFPSGHSMRAIASFGLLTYLVSLWTNRGWFQELVGIVSMLLILLVGFSRLYLGKHYPTDVLAGYTLSGAIVAVGIGLMEMRLRLRFVPQGETTSAPPADPP